MNTENNEIDFTEIFVRLYYGETIEPYRLVRNYFLSPSLGYLDFVIFDETANKIVAILEIDGDLPDDPRHHPYRHN